jgi:predicted GIY-YIG superfamily endonuclease
MTADLPRRIYEHEIGANSKSYTNSRRPVKLVWAGEFNSHDVAFSFEHQVKGWSRAKKEALTQEDWSKIHQIVKNERKKRESKKKSS